MLIPSKNINTDGESICLLCGVNLPVLLCLHVCAFLSVCTRVHAAQLDEHP